MLSISSETVEMPLLNKIIETEEFQYIEKYSKNSQEEVAVELGESLIQTENHEEKESKRHLLTQLAVKQNPRKFGLFYAILKRNDLIGIIFSFLGDELSKIIKIAPSKAFVEVIFGHFVAKYVAETLGKQNYVTPNFLWKNMTDLQTVQIAASYYIKFSDGHFKTSHQTFFRFNGSSFYPWFAYLRYAR